ncbi:MAG: gliding motility lipoprotein GldH [Saprospiraceae bacterium]|nr:gliding motility lipoprotein GldH [Saprospiraceae bacterium]
MQLKIILSGLLFLILLESCSDQHFYSEREDIENGSWNYQDTLSYAVDIRDTVDRYDIGLKLQHSKEYGFENLYIKILTHFPDGRNLSQTLSLDFADHTGRWYGDCRGDVCTLVAILQNNAMFDQLGLHRFQIVQYMRTDPVQGIDQIDLFLDKKSG